MNHIWPVSGQVLTGLFIYVFMCVGLFWFITNLGFTLIVLDSNSSLIIMVHKTHKCISLKVHLKDRSV